MIPANPEEPLLSPAAEGVYLFAHAILRDAAYEIQLPGDRARLHELAVLGIERLYGGRPPESSPEEAVDSSRFKAHRTDPVAEILAHHAFLAIDSPDCSLPLSACVTYLLRAAEVAERRFRNEKAALLWERVSSLDKGIIGATATFRAARALTRSGRPVLAEQMAVDSIRAFNESGAFSSEIRAWITLSSIYENTGRMEEAESALNRALDPARQSRDERLESWARSKLAQVMMYTGRSDEALVLLQRAERVQRRIGELAGLTTTLTVRALILTDQGESSAAERCNIEVLRISRQLGDKTGESIALHNLAVLKDAADDTADAEQLYEQALRIHRAQHNRRHEGMTLGNLGLLRLRQRRYSECEELLREAIEISREFDNRRFEGIHLCVFALLLTATGEFCQAREVWQSGAEILRKLQDTAELEKQTANMHAWCEWAECPPHDGVVEPVRQPANVRPTARDSQDGQL